MKKITMQEIADSLGISRVTVWKVINNHSGVSDELQETILKTASEMGYYKNKMESQIVDSQIIDSPQSSEPITVSVVVSRPESSLFWMNIIHQIAKELVKSNINLMYTYLPSKIQDNYQLPQSLLNGTIKGMIILNVYDSCLLQALNRLSIPKVFLDMVPSVDTHLLTGDLFLLEGRLAIKSITETLIKKGITDIAFMGDINYATTNLDRYYGYKEAMTQNNIAINTSNCLTKSIGIYSYQEEIYKFLSSLKSLPKAFVCASDYVASFLMQYLIECNIKVPETIAVSGYDGSTEYPNTKDTLTTVQVNTKDLGKRLANQLLYRINSPESALEITYIKSKIVYGNSTNIDNL